MTKTPQCVGVLWRLLLEPSMDRMHQSTARCCNKDNHKWINKDPNTIKEHFSFINSPWDFQLSGEVLFLYRLVGLHQMIALPFSRCYLYSHTGDVGCCHFGEPQKEKTWKTAHRKWPALLLLTPYCSDSVMWPISLQGCLGNVIQLCAQQEKETNCVEQLADCHTNHWKRRLPELSLSISLGAANNNYNYDNDSKTWKSACNSVIVIWRLRKMHNMLC